MSIAVPSLLERLSYSCTKLPSLNRVGGSSFTLHLPLPLTHNLLLPIGGGATTVGKSTLAIELTGRCLKRRVEGRNGNRSSRFLLPKYTYNMWLLFSRSCSLEEYREKSGHSESVSHWPYPYMKPGFPSALNPFNSVLAGSPNGHAL